MRINVCKRSYCNTWNEVYSHLISSKSIFLKQRFPEMKVKAKSLRHVWFSATPWTVAYQDPLSMEFSRQEYWSGFPFPPPGDLPDRGIEPRSPALQADTLSSEPLGKPFPEMEITKILENCKIYVFHIFLSSAFPQTLFTSAFYFPHSLRTLTIHLQLLSWSMWMNQWWQ